MTPYEIDGREVPRVTDILRAVLALAVIWGS